MMCFSMLATLTAFGQQQTSPADSKSSVAQGTDKDEGEGWKIGSAGEALGSRAADVNFIPSSGEKVFLRFEPKDNTDVRCNSGVVFVLPTSEEVPIKDQGGLASGWKWSLKGVDIDLVDLFKSRGLPVGGRAFVQVKVIPGGQSTLETDYVNPVQVMSGYNLCHLRFTVIDTQGQEQELWSAGDRTIEYMPGAYFLYFR